MATAEVHLRHYILHKFQQEKYATEVCLNLKKIFVGNAVLVRAFRIWFKQFEVDDFDLNGKPSYMLSIDDGIVRTMIEQDLFLTTSEIVKKKLNSSQQTISYQIRKLVLDYKYSKWVPYELSDKLLHDRVVICIALHVWNANESFLDGMITDDEKWITYENIVRVVSPKKSNIFTSKLSWSLRMLIVQPGSNKL
ncbi:histone-lysine N-methyltransferase SETMAR-like [Stegodyphus dumicola]|uniref:histone-lysine N-methyltransferase SETMAR-like n=1 Tax=Stegodyphus dumicola TaxID=202533 RepID=UPI0015A89B56|nr:histone-lysine N-methyltransferase SETMAR-like [Stegodyphus dumicola]